MKQPLLSGFRAIFYNYILNIRKCTMVWLLKIYNYIVNNFRMCDALPYAKDGTLSEKLDELFG